MLVHNALTNVIIGICGILDSIQRYVIYQNNRW